MISSDYLFHFTQKFEDLVSILNTGLSIQYCLEDFTWINEFPLNISDEVIKNKKVAIPMVCFCDIPPALSKKHSKVYGKFCIALNKKFAIKNGINPIFYINKKSSISSKVIQLITFTSNQNDSKIRGVQLLLNELLGNFKQFQGTFYKNEKIYNEYKFYDEREWRFIPPSSLFPSITEENFNTLLDKKVSVITLHPEYIEYIIVETVKQKTCLIKTHPKFESKIILFSEFNKLQV